MKSTDSNPEGSIYDWFNKKPSRPPRKAPAPNGEDKYIPGLTFFIWSIVLLLVSGPVRLFFGILGSFIGFAAGILFLLALVAWIRKLYR